jgi:hypothetical protein
MSHSPVCPQSRREAMRQARDPALLLDRSRYLAGLSLDPTHLTDAAVTAYDTELKKTYYAHLQKLIQVTVTTTLQSEVPAYSPPTGFLRKLLTPTPVCVFQAAIANQLSVATHALADAEPVAYQLASQLKQRRQELHPNRPSQSLGQVLRGGADTAAKAVTFVLASFTEPDGGVKHTDQTLLRSSDKAVKDYSLVGSYQLAMLHLAAKAGRLPARAISETGSHFRFATDPLETTLDYDMRSRLASDTGGQNETIIKIRDIKNRTPVLGCPIHFTPGQTDQLWNWTIDQALRFGAI